MIVGRGLLANALNKIDNDHYIFYVNGISNSVLDLIPEDNFEFEEVKKIADTNKGQLFVYFSTSQVNSKLNLYRPYVQHKYRIECLIKEKFENYLIIRTSNLVGHNPWNRTSLFNFLYNAISTGKQISLDNSVVRNMLDVDHFVDLLNCFLLKYHSVSKLIEIHNPISYTMADIISEFELFYLKKFITRETEDQNNFAVFELDSTLSTVLIGDSNISLVQYIPGLLKKYYPIT